MRYIKIILLFIKYIVFCATIATLIIAPIYIGSVYFGGWGVAWGFVFLFIIGLAHQTFLE